MHSGYKLRVVTFGTKRRRSLWNVCKHRSVERSGVKCFHCTHVFDLTNLKGEKRRNVGKLNNELNIVNQFVDLHFLLFVNNTGNWKNRLAHTRQIIIADWLSLSESSWRVFYHKESSSPHPEIVPIEGAVLFELVVTTWFTGVKLMTVTVIAVIPRWRTWNQVRIFFVN
jgi:hypothetical protein